MDYPSNDNTYLFKQSVSVQQDLKQYSELKELIIKNKLLERQIPYYIFKSVTTIAAFVMGFLLLNFTKNNLILLTVNAVFISIVLVQFGGIGHDAGHKGITKSAKRNYYLCVLYFGFFLGTVTSWWINKHNEHHAHPNEEDMDPDIDFPIVAFSDRDAKGKKGIAKEIVKYQAFLYPILTILIPLNMRFHSLRILKENKVRHRKLEGFVMLLHFVVMLALLTFFLGFFKALIIYVIINLVTGFQMALFFAPSHKGMPMINKKNKPGYLRQQILTTRNVRPGIFTDFIFAGLNYQIEHHLFPTMPRNNFGKARKLLQKFCRQHKIKYHETSAFRSYVELLKFMHDVGRPLREG